MPDTPSPSPAPPNAAQTLAARTAVITGASSGIGRALALELATADAAVVLHARRRHLLEEVAAAVEAQGGRALVVAGDAGQKADLERLHQAAISWEAGGNGYDIVVVNAGRGLAGGILDSDEEQWEELYRVNALGAIQLMRLAGRYLAERGRGDIVVVGSVVGRNISPFSGFYGSSKFAVGAAAEALRREVCGHGVRVSLVMPGIVESGFQAVAGYTEENFGGKVKKFGRLLRPEDIARPITWLLAQPAHVNVSDITIRPTGQDYP